MDPLTISYLGEDDSTPSLGKEKFNKFRGPEEIQHKEPGVEHPGNQLLKIDHIIK